MSRVSYRRYSTVGGSEIARFKTLTEIEGVMEHLKKVLNENGHVTLEEYYAITNGSVLPGDDEYGWTQLTVGVRIESGRWGYELYLPAAEKLTFSPIDEAIDILQDADERDLPSAICAAINCLNRA